MYANDIGTTYRNARATLSSASRPSECVKEPHEQTCGSGKPFSSDAARAIEL